MPRGCGLSQREVTAQLAHEAKVIRENKAVLDRKLNEKVVNLSIDDVEIALNEITVNSGTYTSLFEGNIFGHLKYLHDKYGAKFSLFLFTNNVYSLANVTDKFKDEFKDNADWLSFGFHGKDLPTLYNEVPLSTFKTDYETFLTQVKRFASIKNICYHNRFSSFYSTGDVVNAFKTEYSGKGLFTADDDRSSYDLNTEENKRIKIDGVIRRNGFNYVESIYRIDNLVAGDVSGFLKKGKL